MSSAKFEKLRASLRKKTEENRKKTQEKLREAEKIKKQLITAKLAKWAIIVSGQGDLLFAGEYGLNLTQVRNSD